MRKSLLLLSTMEQIQRQFHFGQYDFEKECHLVLTPPVGTTVILHKPISYLRDYHGVSMGQLGTVVAHSRLTSDDNGVLVDWDGTSAAGVRMDLDELQSV